MPRLLYATNNPGKFGEVNRLAAQQGVQLFRPLDFKLEHEPDETGASLEENAILKANAFRQFVPDDVYVVADDTGVEIDALGGEPGIYVRRWQDRAKKMSDEEIIAYTIERMRGIPLPRRGAQMRTVLALSHPDGEVEVFDGILRGVIVEQPTPQRIEGFPFESLFYIPEYQMMLGDLHQLPDSRKPRYLTHRERAFMKLLPRWRSL
jgi:XTP/dITP diphosphohydrolase